MPPRLPIAVPLVRKRPVGLDRRGRKTGLSQRLPSAGTGISSWQALFMKQGIPVVREPLDERQEVLVYGIQPLALLDVGAEVPPVRPQLKAALGRAYVAVCPASVMRIWAERQADGEVASIAHLQFPQNGHRWSPSPRRE